MIPLPSDRHQPPQMPNHSSERGPCGSTGSGSPATAATTIQCVISPRAAILMSGRGANAKPLVSDLLR
jgi:hypothetical protein